MGLGGLNQEELNEMSADQLHAVLTRMAWTSISEDPKHLLRAVLRGNAMLVSAVASSEGVPVRVLPGPNAHGDVLVQLAKMRTLCRLRAPVAQGVTSSAQWAAALALADCSGFKSHVSLWFVLSFQLVCRMSL